MEENNLQHFKENNSSSVPKWEDGPPPENNYVKPHTFRDVFIGILIGIFLCAFIWPRVKPIVMKPLLNVYRQYIVQNQPMLQNQPSVDSSNQSNTSSSNETVYTATPKTSTIHYAMGVAFDIGGVSVTVTGFDLVDSIEDEFGSYSPEAGNMYAVASLMVENEGNVAVKFLPSFGSYDDISVKLVYRDQYEYVASTLLAYDGDLHDILLNPLTSKTGVIAFQVPDTIANSYDKLALVLSAGAKKIEVIVRK